jgi:hypothetical protein
MILALVAARASAGCDAATLQDALDRAEGAFVQMDEGTFDAAAADARTTLSCMQDVLTPVQCAGFHRMNALEAFLHGDHATTVLYFQAVLGTQAGYELPEDIAPEGHPLRDDFLKSKQFTDDSRFPLQPPAIGWLTIDGRRSTDAPSGRPYLFQWLDEVGVPRTTAWVKVGSPVPQYAKMTVAAPVPAPLPVPVPEPAGHGGGGALTAVGIGAAVVGAGLYGGAFVVHGSYVDAVAAGDEDKILSTHGTTNLLTVSGLALLGGGATLTLIGVF